MEIKNIDELDEWLFDRVQRRGHRCDAIKGIPKGGTEEVNVAWRDSVTGSIMRVEYYED